MTEIGKELSEENFYISEIKERKPTLRLQKDPGSQGNKPSPTYCKGMSCHQQGQPDLQHKTNCYTRAQPDLQQKQTVTPGFRMTYNTTQTVTVTYHLCTRPDHHSAGRTSRGSSLWPCTPWSYANALPSPPSSAASSSDPRQTSATPRATGGSD